MIFELLSPLFYKLSNSFCEKIIDLLAVNHDLLNKMLKVQCAKKRTAKEFKTKGYFLLTV